MRVNKVSLAYFYEILSVEIDEELEKDILDYIYEETGVEEEILYEYFLKNAPEDILYELKEYQAKWNPSSEIYDIVVEECSHLRGGVLYDCYSSKGKNKKNFKTTSRVVRI